MLLFSHHAFAAYQFRPERCFFFAATRGEMLWVDAGRCCKWRDSANPSKLKGYEPLPTDMLDCKYENLLALIQLPADYAAILKRGLRIG